MVSASGIDTVAIVGGGFMGTGIAEAVALAGLHVVVRDVDEASIERAREDQSRRLPNPCVAPSWTALPQTL
jgi:3-hydroxyacyl-CoA dehydrogenase